MEFEKPRGVSRVEVRDGYAMAHISGLTGNLAEARLDVLDIVASTGISLDFLKLTPAGLSFLILEDEADGLHQALDEKSVPHEILRPRSIVLIHAVNIRDEEGVIAGIVKALIDSAATADHLGDMHDRMLAVVPTSDARRIADHFRATFGK
jgi:aspartokinase